MKKLLTYVLLAWMVTPALATLENMPDIGAYNWKTGDDFSNLNYSLNNWDNDIPSAITFGINTSYGYGYMRAGYTTSNVYGNMIPTQSSDIIGIRADIRLSSASIQSDSVSYYALGIDIAPDIALYWGISVLNSQVKSVLLLDQSAITGHVSVLDAGADFDVNIGSTYNLAIAFYEPTGEYNLYLNGQKKTSFYFPEQTSLTKGYIRMYSRKLDSRMEFDNVEFATIPEPATALLFSVGCLMIRKYKFMGEK